MSKYGELTPVTIWQIACDVDEKTANPADVRELLEYLCDTIDRKDPIPRELQIYLARAFRQFLSGDSTLQAALGLARKKARPKADAVMRTMMATEILRKRLANLSHQNAVVEVAEKYGYGETVVGQSWAEYKHDALIHLRLERQLDKFPWSPHELERLLEIFDSDTKFIASLKSMTIAA